MKPKMFSSFSIFFWLIWQCFKYQEATVQFQNPSAHCLYVHFLTAKPVFLSASWRFPVTHSQQKKRNPNGFPPSSGDFSRSQLYWFPGRFAPWWLVLFFILATSGLSISSQIFQKHQWLGSSPLTFACGNGRSCLAYEGRQILGHLFYLLFFRVSIKAPQKITECCCLSRSESLGCWWEQS